MTERGRKHPPSRDPAPRRNRVPDRLGLVPDPASDRRTGQRRLRVAEAMRHALARLLQDGTLRDPALAGASITVTEIRLSPDMRNATAYVMPLGGINADAILAALHRCTAHLKGPLARAVAMRQVPGLVFALDRSFDEARHIDALLASPAVVRDLAPAAEDSADEDPADPDHDDAPGG
jgi:ribosome-binding factor A